MQYSYMHVYDRYWITDRWRIVLILELSKIFAGSNQAFFSSILFYPYLYFFPLSGAGAGAGAGD